MLLYFTKKKHQHKIMFFSTLMLIITSTNLFAIAINDSTDLSCSQNNSNTLIKISSIPENCEYFIKNEQQKKNSDNKAPVVNLRKQENHINQQYQDTATEFYSDNPYPNLAINSSSFCLYSINNKYSNSKRTREHEKETTQNQISNNNQNTIKKSFSIEEDNDSSDILWQLYEKISLLEREVATLKELQENNRERYIDIDQRIMALQSELYAGNSSTINNTAEAGVTEQIELARSDMNNSVYKAKLLVQKNNHSKAIDILTKTQNSYPLTKETLDQYPELFNVYFWIAEINMHLGYYDVALTTLKNMEKTWKKHDRIPEVSYKIGVLLRNKGNIKESNAIFKNIINKHPESNIAKIANKILNN